MTTKQLTQHAAAAKMIRAALKAAYPSVEFSVRSKSYSGGDSVRIHWTDGPTSAQVEALTSQHEMGHFDGSIDLYEYSNRRDDIPQVKFVQTQRDTSRAVAEAAVAHLNARYGWDLAIADHEYKGRGWWDYTNDAYDGGEWRVTRLHRWLYALPLLCPAGHATLPGDAFCPECGQALATDAD